jgi:hypothetical protein
MKRLTTILILLFFIVNIHSQNKEINPVISSQEILDHISYLASDELEGRFTGSDACYQAGEYIKNEFVKYGLLPLGGNSYFQEFSFIEDVELTENNSLTITINNISYPLNLNEDFITTPFSGNSNISADLVFAGYGISAPKLEYDDYEGIDVTGKIVLVMRYSPEFDNPHSQFDQYSSFRQKASVAKDKGAAGIIFVNGHLPETSEDKLMEFKYDRAAGIKDFSAVHVTRNFVDDLFQAEKFDLKELQKKISESKKPSSFFFRNSKVSMQTEVKEIEKTGRNVIGYIEGADPNLKDEYIVFGAHYDHLGYGKHGSLYRGDEPQIHNGADDNSSGTTGVLELAEKFSSIKDKLKRSIIFMSFAGEELGLLGSNYFVNQSPIPTENIATMINMDMIGRLNEENQLTVFGTGTSKSWEDLLNENNKYDLNLSFKEDGYGPSDHSSFYGKQIPVLFFFTGTHPQYHRPTDDVELINIAGEETVLKYVFDVAQQIINEDSKPEYVLVPRKQTSNVGGWKVYVGTIPDYAYSGEGFKLTGVSEGGPAQKAGLQGGDIMLKFGDKEINNIYDYVYALKEYVPGDVVDVKVKRGEETLTFEVEMGAK